jgi:hypothetical protein
MLVERSIRTTNLCCLYAIESQVSLAPQGNKTRLQSTGGLANNVESRSPRERGYSARTSVTREREGLYCRMGDIHHLDLEISVEIMIEKMARFERDWRAVEGIGILWCIERRRGDFAGFGRSEVPPLRGHVLSHTAREKAHGCYFVGSLHS